MKEIWLIYSSQKGGHKYPAFALAEYLSKEHPQFQPTVINLLPISQTLAFFDRIGRFGDLHLPFLWRTSAKSLIRGKTLFPYLYRGILKLTIGLSHSKDFLLKKGRPSLIISFQPELNTCALLFKRWFSCPFYSIVIDLLLHDLWVERDIDRYYVLNEKAKEELKRWGVGEEKVVVSGLPLREGFRKVREENLLALKEKWHIPTDKPCLLLMGGLLGRMVDFSGVIKSIKEVREPLSLILILGENRKRKFNYQKWQKSFPPHLTIIPLGQVEEIFELMALADIIITKPSSGTISEASALGKPLLLIPPTGGAYQDIRFALFLEKEGAAVWVKEIGEIGEMVKRILKSKDWAHNLSENIQRFGVRNLLANKIIAESLMGD